MEHEEQSQSKWQVPFFTVWTGQALSLIGSRVAQFALIWYLTESTGSATVLATASMMALLPGIFLGPFIGALVDRWNRRIVMIVADTIIALAILWLAYLFWIDNLQIWQIYAIMLVRAIGGSFHWPAMSASTSLMVPKEHLARVAGINQALNGALNIIGPPLGALLMQVLPMQGIMMVDVATAALAIGPLFFISIPQPERAGENGGQKQSLWADMAEGVRYLRGWSGMMVLIGFALIFKIALTPAFSLIPLLVSEHFGGDAAQLSLMDATAGVGIILGGVFLSVWGGFKRQIYTILMGVLVFSLSFIVLGLTPAGMFGLALVTFFVIGAMLPLIDGPLMAIMQGSVAPEMQGRVFTLMSSLLNLTGPISLAFAGPVSDLLGLQSWYVAAGVLCGASGVLGFFIPAIVNIEENNNGHAAQDKAQPVTATEIAVPVGAAE